MIPTKISFRNESFQNQLILVFVPDRNFRFQSKCGLTFLQYHAKEVRTLSGRHMDWLRRSADSCYRSADVFTALSFQNENFYVNVEWTMCVLLEWNSFRYHINTTLIALKMFSKIFIALEILPTVPTSHSFIPELNENFYVKVKWTMCVLLEWNSFRHLVNTTLV